MTCCHLLSPPGNTDSSDSADRLEGCRVRRAVQAVHAYDQACGLMMFKFLTPFPCRTVCAGASSPPAATATAPAAAGAPPACPAAAHA
jgi:hypothetical protein